jgi:hypothetical protein
MISLKHKFLFIHIPKTGGTSLRTWLYEILQDPSMQILKKHVTAKQVENVIDRPERYFKFTFVRNPWDMLVSQYFKARHSDAYLKNYGQDKRDWHWENSFERFVYRKPRPVPLQMSRICTRDGKLLPDFLGRFERLEKDAHYILERIGVDIEPPPMPKINVSPHHHYATYYNKSMRDHVAKVYADDIKEFGYEFER